MLTITIVIFVIALFVIELSFHAYRTIQNPDGAEIRKRLKRVVVEAQAEEKRSALPRRGCSARSLSSTKSSPSFQERPAWTCSSSRPILRYTFGFFFLASICLALTVYQAISILTRNPTFSR